ncbi:Sugar transporter STL1, partial [Pseudocercospora fuligena]
MLRLKGHKLEVAQLLLVVLPAFVLFGYNLSGVGGLVTVKDWAATFPSIDTVDTSGETKSHNSTVQVFHIRALGALFGSLACTWIGDPLGRRRTVLIAGILTFIGEVLECSAFQLAQFVVGRFILGLGVGILSTSVPVWQSECSQAKNRGQHVVLDGCFMAVGYCLQAWVNLAFYQIKTGPLSWRLPLAMPTLISLVLISSIFMFPESPRWLAKKGRYEQARQNLAVLRDLPEDGLEISSEINAIELSLEETSSAARKRDLFTMGEYKVFYRFALCMVLQFLQQWCGTNLISVYSTIIFQQGLGLDSQLSRIMSGAALTWKLISCSVAFYAVDRFGRRKLFMISGAGMSSCMTALAIASSFPKSDFGAQVASVFFVFLFNFFVPIGFLGANYLYVTEIAPARLRMPMTSFATANHWLWNFVILMVTPVAVETIGYQYYIVYAVLGACIPVLVFLFYPETMGRTLEQMEDLFREGKSISGIVRASLSPPLAEAARLDAILSKQSESSIRIERKDDV